MPLHDPLAHQRLSAPALQALCDAHARAHLRQDKRDLLCAIGMGFGMVLTGVGTTLLLAWSRCGHE
jgi:hypothetical protein